MISVSTLSLINLCDFYTLTVHSDNPGLHAVFQQFTTVFCLFDKVWRTFPTDENGNVNFQSFVGVLMWWKTAPLEQKLEGIFIANVEINSYVAYLVLHNYCV